MKKFDQKYFTIGLMAIIVICVCASFIYFLFNHGKVGSGLSALVVTLMPIIDGVILTYLLSPVLNYIEKHFVKRIYHKFQKKPFTPKIGRRIRAISILLTMIITVVVVGSFISIVIPQLVLSLQSITQQFPVYINNLYLWVSNLLVKNPDLESFVNQVYYHYSETITNYLREDLLPHANSLLRTLSLSVVGVVKALWNFIIGFIISIYMLASKELFMRQAKDVIYAIFNGEKAGKIIQGLKFSHKTFTGFISGKIVDSIIIGLICFLCTSIIGTPYAVLISCIVGVTNVIPFFGPYIGAIPSALLVLMVDPKHCLYFIILILIIQQVDGNIIGPKILGDSTGLSSFWVIFSITLFGGIFGIPGMILGVPVFAVIYAGIKYWVYKTLEKKKDKASVKQSIEQNNCIEQNDSAEQID